MNIKDLFVVAIFHPEGWTFLDVFLFPSRQRAVTQLFYVRYLSGLLTGYIHAIISQRGDLNLDVQYLELWTSKRNVWYWYQSVCKVRNNSLDYFNPSCGWLRSVPLVWNSSKEKFIWVGIKQCMRTLFVELCSLLSKDTIDKLWKESFGKCFVFITTSLRREIMLQTTYESGY